MAMIRLNLKGTISTYLRVPKISIGFPASPGVIYKQHIIILKYYRSNSNNNKTHERIMKLFLKSDFKVVVIL